ncbi:MAG: AAA family ATPase [Gammaproteobacteria bacterium]|nr:AAA family ATPase [Gammaproteobacteria bacterium]
MAHQRLPLGIQTLKGLRQDNCYYVDKTTLIHQLVSNGRYYFLSRPRRFGKSLLLDTLRELFEGNESLFRDLYIYEHWDWSVNFPVVHLSFDGEKYHKSGGLDRNIDYQLLEIENDFDIEPPPEPCSGPERFSRLIKNLHRKTGQEVVVLIDEYDKPILDAIDDRKIALENRKNLRSFFSVIKHNARRVRFVFVTGVTMFSKFSLFSDLNHLTDISLRANYATICGYTDHDLESVFAPELEGLDRKEIRRWYNGYHWLGEEKVYNPWDILNLLDNRKFESYWFASGSPAFLYKVMMQRQFSPMQIPNLTVDEKFITTFDIDRISVEALMFQAGYLTITHEKLSTDGTRYTLNYPNHEVQICFKDELLNYLSGGNCQVQHHSDKLIKLLLALDFDGFTAQLRSLLAAIPYQWQGEHSPARYEAWYGSMLFVALDAPGVDIRLEDVSSQGRADMVLLHGGHVFVFEFKMIETPNDPQSEVQRSDAAAAAAIERIQERGYMDKYRCRGEPIYLIGMVFDRNGKGEKPLELKAIAA